MATIYIYVASPLTFPVCFLQLRSMGKRRSRPSERKNICISLNTHSSGKRVAVSQDNLILLTARMEKASPHTTSSLMSLQGPEHPPLTSIGSKSASSVEGGAQRDLVSTVPLTPQLPPLACKSRHDSASYSAYACTKLTPRFGACKRVLRHVAPTHECLPVWDPEVWTAGKPAGAQSSGPGAVHLPELSPWARPPPSDSVSRAGLGAVRRLRPSSEQWGHLLSGRCSPHLVSTQHSGASDQEMDSRAAKMTATRTPQVPP